MLLPTGKVVAGWIRRVLGQLATSRRFLLLPQPHRHQMGDHHHFLHAERAGFISGLGDVPEVNAPAVKGVGTREHLHAVVLQVAIQANGTFLVFGASQRNLDRFLLGFLDKATPPISLSLAPGEIVLRQHHGNKSGRHGKAGNPTGVEHGNLATKASWLEETLAGISDLKTGMPRSNFPGEVQTFTHREGDSGFPRAAQMFEDLCCLLCGEHGGDVKVPLGARLTQRVLQHLGTHVVHNGNVAANLLGVKDLLGEGAVALMEEDHKDGGGGCWWPWDAMTGVQGLLHLHPKAQESFGREQGLKESR